MLKLECVFQDEAMLGWDARFYRDKGGADTVRMTVDPRRKQGACRMQRPLLLFYFSTKNSHTTAIDFQSAPAFLHWAIR